VAAPDVGGQLLERPSRARGYRPFQVTVDDSGELGRAGAKLGEEAVVSPIVVLLVAACRWRKRGRYAAPAGAAETESVIR
jgi:hypothetical protein